jgi:hypothetical protein
VTAGSNLDLQSPEQAIRLGRSLRRNGKLSPSTIAKVILAAAVSVGMVILGLALSLHFGKNARPRPPIGPRDSAAIVVEAEVKNWEPIVPDGPIDRTSPDRQITHEVWEDATKGPNPPPTAQHPSYAYGFKFYTEFLYSSFKPVK